MSGAGLDCAHAGFQRNFPAQRSSMHALMINLKQSLSVQAGTMRFEYGDTFRIVQACHIAEQLIRQLETELPAAVFQQYIAVPLTVREQAVHVEEDRR